MCQGFLAVGVVTGQLRALLNAEIMLSASDVVALKLVSDILTLNT